MDFERSMHTGRSETRPLGLRCPFCECCARTLIESECCVCKREGEIEEDTAGGCL